MKKLIVLILMSMVFILPTMAQTQPATPQEVITVNKSDLTADQLAKIQADAYQKELTSRIEAYGKWAGVGKEIGIGIKESLMAVVDVSEKFGNTKVGNFTMLMVAWKILYKDLVRILLGLIFLAVVPTIIWKAYRRLCTRKILLKTNGWQFWLPKEYKLIDAPEWEGIEFVKILLLAMIVGSFGITYGIMFS